MKESFRKMIKILLLLAWGGLFAMGCTLQGMVTDLSKEDSIQVQLLEKTDFNEAILVRAQCSGESSVQLQVDREQFIVNLNEMIDLQDPKAPPSPVGQCQNGELQILAPLLDSFTERDLEVKVVKTSKELSTEFGYRRSCSYSSPLVNLGNSASELANGYQLVDGQICYPLAISSLKNEVFVSGACDVAPGDYRVLTRYSKDGGLTWDELDPQIAGPSGWRYNNAPTYAMGAYMSRNGTYIAFGVDPVTNNALFNFYTKQNDPLNPGRQIYSSQGNPVTVYSVAGSTRNYPVGGVEAGNNLFISGLRRIAGVWGSFVAKSSNGGASLSTIYNHPGWNFGIAKDRSQRVYLLNSTHVLNGEWKLLRTTDETNFVEVDSFRLAAGKNSNPDSLFQPVGGDIFVFGQGVDSSDNLHLIIRKSPSGDPGTWSTVLQENFGLGSFFLGTPSIVAGRNGHLFLAISALVGGVSHVITYKSADKGASWSEIDRYSFNSTDTYSYGMTTLSNGDVVMALSSLHPVNGMDTWLTRKIPCN
jgi:hypothetical protein